MSERDDRDEWLMAQVAHGMRDNLGIDLLLSADWSDI